MDISLLVYMTVERQQKSRFPKLILYVFVQAAVCDALHYGMGKRYAILTSR